MTHSQQKQTPRQRLIGVRLSNSRFFRMYTYRVSTAAAVFLGQLVVPETPVGFQVAMVVKLDPPVPEGFTYETLKTIELAVSTLPLLRKPLRR